MAPLVSVIVPVYNTEKYMQRCIESILSQTHREIELILVDDGSVDSSKDICQKYARDDNRVRFCSKQNGGASSARNMGLSMASGKYVAFIDSDDWVEEKYIEELLAPMEKDELIDISIGLYIVDTVAGKEKHCFHVHPPQYIENRTALAQLMDVSYWGAGGHVKLYRSSLLCNVFYDEKMVWGEDLDFNWKLFQKAKKIYYAGIEKYHYTENPFSISRGNTSKYVFGLLDWLSEIKHGLAGNDNCQLEQAVNSRLLSVYYEALERLFLDDFTTHRLIIRKLHNEYCHEIINSLKMLGGDLLWNDLLATYRDINDIYIYYEQIALELKEKHDIYIYGAGEIARKWIDYFSEKEIPFKGCVVSEGTRNNNDNQEDVIPFSQLLMKDTNHIFLILGMSDKNIHEVYSKIRTTAFSHLIYRGIYLK